MPAPGTFVTYYVHDSWDNSHRAVDSPALVLEELANGVLRLQVFQWGVAPFQVEVGEFPEDLPRDAAGNPVYGGMYWREGDVPDFQSVYATAEEAATADRLEAEYEAEAEALRIRQQQETNNVKDDKAAQALSAKHAQEWTALEAKYAAPAQTTPQPTEVAKPKPKSGLSL